MNQNNGRGGQPTVKRFCPIIREPSDSCHCTKLGIKDFENALHFCCDNFESCEIFTTRLRKRIEIENSIEF